jgi:hypothetical protein
VFIDMQYIWCDCCLSCCRYVCVFIDMQYICRHKCLDTCCGNIKYVQVAAFSENVLCTVTCNVFCNVMFKVFFYVLCNVMSFNIGDIIIVTRHVAKSS